MSECCQRVQMQQLWKGYTDVYIDQRPVWRRCKNGAAGTRLNEVRYNAVDEIRRYLWQNGTGARCVCDSWSSVWVPIPDEIEGNWAGCLNASQECGTSIGDEDKCERAELYQARAAVTAEYGL